MSSSAAVGCRFFLVSWVCFASLFAQTIPVYTIRTVAGGGPGSQAVLLEPGALAVDGSGNVYVSELARPRIRRIAPNGVLTTVAGTGVSGYSGEGAVATEARVGAIFGMVVDAEGSLYFAEIDTCRIRRLTTQGTLTTVAGTGLCRTSPSGAPATSASLNQPNKIAFDPAGRLVWSETGGNQIRRLEADGRITVVGGNGTVGQIAENAAATESPIGQPTALIYDREGRLYLSQFDECRIRVIDTAGRISSFAGTGTCALGPDTGLAASLPLGQVRTLLIDGDGNLLVGDSGANRIRKIEVASGRISTIAGVQPVEGAAVQAPLAFAGDGGTVGGARFARPTDLALDSSGNLYVADRFNYRVRRIDRAGRIETIAGRPPFGGDGGSGSLALLYSPTDLTIRANGDVLVTDTGNHRIRRIAANGMIDTIAGAGGYGISGGVDGPATGALLSFPLSVAADDAPGPIGGQLYFTEAGGHVRQIDGVGRLRASIEGLQDAFGLAVHSDAFVYVGDRALSQIFRRSAASLDLWAGIAGGGFGGDGGRGNLARFRNPAMLAVNRLRELLVADQNNNRIRLIGPSTAVTTFAGNGGTQSSGDGGPAAEAGIPSPFGVAFDAAGNIYVTEETRIRRIDRAGMIATIAGVGNAGFSGDGGRALEARLDRPTGIKVDPSGNVWFVDRNNDRVRVLSPLRAQSLQAVGGDGQSAAISTAFAQPLRVRVVGNEGIPVAGVEIGFAVTPPAAASLSAPRAISNADGIAEVRVTAGGVASGATVTAGAPQLGSVRFLLTIVTVVVPPPRPNAPMISAGGIIQPGNFGGRAVVSPGSWVEIYGSQFSDSTATWENAFTDDRAPAMLNGVRVTVDRKPAFVQLVSPNQINVQIPDGTAVGDVKVQVINAEGASNEATVGSVPRSPALWSPPSFAAFGRRYVAAQFTDGTFAAPPELLPGADFRRAKSGDRLILYGIGFGATTPASPAGQAVSGTPLLPNVRFRAGFTAFPVEYAGLAPGFLGLYQFNIVVPVGLSGDTPLSVTVDGIPIAQELYLAIE